jgi:hypothetical protein
MIVIRPPDSIYQAHGTIHNGTFQGRGISPSSGMTTRNTPNLGLCGFLMMTPCQVLAP